VIKEIPVGDYPVGIAYSPSNNHIYVANQGSNSITEISGSTHTIIRNVPVGKYPTLVAYNPVNSHIYVTNAVDDTISVIHP
jgi:YVTN family beta-propeller protein